MANIALLGTGSLDLINDADAEKSQRATAAMLHMKKLDIDQLQHAYAG